MYHVGGTALRYKNKDKQQHPSQGVTSSACPAPRTVLLNIYTFPWVARPTNANIFATWNLAALEMLCQSPATLYANFIRPGNSFWWYREIYCTATCILSKLVTNDVPTWPAVSRLPGWDREAPSAECAKRLTVIHIYYHVPAMLLTYLPLHYLLIYLYTCLTICLFVCI